VHIEVIPCLRDNYAYLLIDRGEAVVIDPSEYAPVAKAIAQQPVSLKAIWNTHHHWDHVGGNEQLADEFECEVVASAYDLEKSRVPSQTRAVCDGDTVQVGGAVAKVLETPGHTLGAVCFHFEKESALFTGDTLFALGCGRLFEGSAEQMWRSLSGLKSLPAATRLYCGHEYTLSNGRFLKAQLPSPALDQYLSDASTRKVESGSTMGVTLAEELKANGFFRADDLKVQAALGLDSPDAAFAELRRRKDEW
jgi:hydroxyacylglutathione hydrolase